MSQYTYPLPPLFRVWMCDITYVVGIDLYGNPVSPFIQSITFDRKKDPPIYVRAQWDTEITAVYFYGQHITGYYADPIVVVPDYPFYAIVFKLWVKSAR